MTRQTQQDPLAAVDAFAEIRDIPSKVVLKGGDERAPLVTIAIPTFRRPDMLADTVRSALAQDFDRPFEVLVVDNDPESEGVAALLTAVPALAAANFRYIVNGRDLGMYGNHNRAIDAARGEWVTILHDDDLLDPDFLRTMFAAIDRWPEVRGLVARKRVADDRGSLALGPRALPRRFAARLLFEAYFHGRELRPIPPRKLFWGPLVGNVSGFVIDRAAALELGGFQPRDRMAADHFFFLRFARRFGLWQHRAERATIRVAANESMKRETLLSFLADYHRILAGLPRNGTVPQWWRRFDLISLARLRARLAEEWHVALDDAEVRATLGFDLPRDRPVLYRAIRLSMRGF